MITSVVSAAYTSSLRLAGTGTVIRLAEVRPPSTNAALASGVAWPFGKTSPSGHTDTPLVPEPRLTTVRLTTTAVACHGTTEDRSTMKPGALLFCTPVPSRVSSTRVGVSGEKPEPACATLVAAAAAGTAIPATRTAASNTARLNMRPPLTRGGAHGC